ncbi:hypothetical protein XhyaCFBP1156_15005 [Xanthomonas hyacinthi]|uniref:Homocysteine S-methyltransferase n=1 Tax=Xanthomonas hyacinthi TaxID=56455 RepID=A0A2S7ETK7_9XANT|nr:hypothetical protein Y886_09840 [Xanthomonas hyacinthi DSM 19077]PPU96415.1 hypothetical protein XhyaCFBP1156_15005 [Xanthomonas hyacinthi]
MAASGFAGEAATMPRSNPLTALLAAGRCIVLDGALATELEARGCDLGDALWSARASPRWSRRAWTCWPDRQCRCQEGFNPDRALPATPGRG